MRKIAKLTHYGRKSGKAYTVKVWFRTIDGAVWIGSLDDERSWVKNVANGEFELDCGDGKCRYRAVGASDAEAERFRAEIRAQHPILFPLLSTLVKKNRCVFRCDPVR